MRRHSITNLVVGTLVLGCGWGQAEAPADAPAPVYSAVVAMVRAGEGAKIGCAESQALYAQGMALYDGVGVQRNYPQAFELLKKAADLGHAYAAVVVGIGYETGIIGEGNLPKAFEYYKQAADSGLAMGRMGEALFYASGAGTPQNIEKSNQLKQAAWDALLADAEAGDAHAMFFVAIMYLYDFVEPRNEKKAFEWYECASKGGSQAAICNLAICYLSGIGVKQDVVKSMELLEQKQLEGNPLAMTVLACMYINAMKDEATVAKGEELLRKAAEMNYLMACQTLATYGENGQMQMTQQEITMLLEKAIENDSPMALYELAGRHEIGKGTPKNLVRATELYKAAILKLEGALAIKLHFAAYYLGECYYFGRGVQEDVPRAIQYFTQGAEGGNSMAQYILAECYACGFGVEKDMKRAKELYKKAADDGDSRAARALERIEKQG